MQIKTFVERLVQDISLKFWSKQEQNALLRVLHDIYNSDHVISIKETKKLNRTANLLNVDPEKINHITLQQAFDILSNDKLKEELIYILLAEALFEDEDYDNYEENHVRKLVHNYPVSGELLQQKIDEVQHKKLTSVLSEWLEQIEKTPLS